MNRVSKSLSRDYRKINDLLILEGLRVCYQCNKIKEITYFGKDKDKRDGFVTKCKECLGVGVGRKRLRGSMYKTIDGEKYIVCVTCNETKSLEHYYTSKTVKSGYQHECKDCNKEFSRKRHMIRNYNISEQELDYYLSACDNSCEICGDSFNDTRMNIDHNHLSGKFRGLLCGKCNMALGLMRDSLSNLESAANYIKEKI